MSAKDVLAELEAAGVGVYLEGRRLRGKAAPGAYTDSLKRLVDAHRVELVAYLEDRLRRDGELRRVEDLLGQAAVSARQRAGREVVLAIYRDLARRWNATGDAKLFEVAEAVEALYQRWEQEDHEARSRRLPPGWR